MRIVIANKFAHITGGADRHCLGLAAALRSRGHDVAFLSTDSPANLDTAGCFIECKVSHATRDDLKPRQQAAAAAAALWNRDAAQAMTRLIADVKPDILHVHKLYPQLSVAPVVVAARHDIPVVQTLHDYELISASPLDDHAGALDRHEERSSYRALNALLHQLRQHVHVPRVTEWTACSRFVAERYAARGIDAVPIPNFVEESAAPTDHDPLRRDGVVFCGRLSPEKGVQDVLQMARELPEHRVTIAGTGDLAPLVTQAAASLPNLTYVGHLDSASLMNLLRSARVVAIPSRWAEPGALITLEAMSAGTPVVVYRSGGLTEYVTDAGGGRVVAADVRELISACQVLHDGFSEWTRCSRAAADAMRRRHSPAAFVAKLETVYEQAISSGNGRHVA